MSQRNSPGAFRARGPGCRGVLAAVVLAAASVASLGPFSAGNAYAQARGRSRENRDARGAQPTAPTNASPTNAATPAPGLPPPQDFFATPTGEQGTRTQGGGTDAETRRTKTHDATDTREPEDPSYSIRGLKSWYAQFDSGFGVDEVSRCDPGAEDCSKPITESHYNLQLAFLMGWGPLRTDNFFFNVHYKYSHNWSTDYAQVERFQEKWFGDRKAENFLFPTKSMLRTHEFAGDLRYIYNPWQLGLFTRLTVGRIGSQTLGEKDERAETIVKTENFVPYLSYKWDRYYRGQLSSPFRTEINKDDGRLSNASYSWSSNGRGRAFSLKLSNGLYLPPLDSLVYLDLYRLEYKYASIQNDRVRTGVSGSFDFPVIWDLRVSPRAAYYKETFLVNRVRIPGYSKTTARTKLNEPAKEYPRKDTYLSFGLYTYWDFSRAQRVDFSILRETTSSTLTEFNVTRNLLVLGYSYSWPSTNIVTKRVDRFSESPYAEEF